MKTKERIEADRKWRKLATGANGSQPQAEVRYREVIVTTTSRRLSQAEIKARRAGRVHGGRHAQLV